MANYCRDCKWVRKGMPFFGKAYCASPDLSRGVRLPLEKARTGSVKSLNREVLFAISECTHWTPL